MSERTWRGSGVTRREYNVYRGTKGTVTVSGPPGVAATARLAIFDFMEEMKRTCATVLRAAGLPDRLATYVKIDGKWRETDNGDSPEFLRAHDTATLYGLVMNSMRVEEDSDAGYAVQILTHIERVEDCIGRGAAIEALDSAWFLGALHTEWSFKRDWERPALHGQAMKRGEKNLDRLNAAKKRDAANMQRRLSQEIERVRSVNPTLTDAALAARVSEAMNGEKGTSKTTVQRLLRKKSRQTP